MIEDALAAVEDSLDAMRRKVYGVVSGRVKEVDDPLGLGRVRVQLPFLDPAQRSAWARVAAPSAGLLHGSYFVPNVDDEVLVAFEHGDQRAPYIIGALWSVKAPPPLRSPRPEVRAIRTRAGNQLVITESPMAVALQTGPTSPAALPAPASSTGPHQTILMSAEGVQVTTPTKVELLVGATKVTVTPTGVTITAGSSSATLTPTGVEIRGALVSIVASGTLTLRGATVLIN